MKAGIVGLPNVGKSTLFNCLSNTKAQSANFPFCTIEPNHSIINVPDKRLITLQEIVNPEKLIPATVEIVDIAGLVKGASKGEGLGNKFLANIRETDAIIHVLRCFDNDNITHVDGSVDPIRDKEIIDIELQLKDLESLNNRLEKVSRTVKSGDKEAAREKEVLNQAISFIESSNNIRSIDLDEDDINKYLKPLQLITSKPVLYVANTDEGEASQALVSKLQEKADKEKADKEKAAKEQAEKDKAARRKAARELAAKQKAAKERAAKERAALTRLWINSLRINLILDIISHLPIRSHPSPDSGSERDEHQRDYANNQGTRHRTWHRHPSRRESSPAQGRASRQALSPGRACQAPSRHAPPPRAPAPPGCPAAG